MNAQIPVVLGSKISLISKSDVRYEGILMFVDSQGGIVVLANVKSLGTEDRQTQFPVPPRNTVYGQIYFRSSEIKDARVPMHRAVALPSNPITVQLCVEDCEDIFGQRLSLLIEEGHDGIAKLLLQDNIRGLGVPTKTQLLQCAARYGSSKVAQYLLARGCDVNAQDSMGTTPLMMSVKGKHEAVMKGLLAAGADILSVNKDNKSALHICCADHELPFTMRQAFLREFRKTCSSTEDCADKLIDAGCQLYQAAHLDDSELIEYMLNRGFQVNDVQPQQKCSVMHVAVRLGNFQMVKSLAQHGANARFNDERGANPLFYWYQCGQTQMPERIEILKILMDLRTPATSCISSGEFQVQSILINGNLEAIRVLLQSNLDFTATDNVHQRSALHYLSMNRNAGVAEELRVHAKQFDVNALDADGTSPLYCAAKQGNLSMVAFLLDKGADANVEHAVLGFTSLYYAYLRAEGGLEKEYDQCVELLLQNYANPQFVIGRDGTEQITIFEAASAATSWNRMKPAVSQLAVLEKLGTPITQLILDKINLYPPLFKYLNRCRGKIEETVTGNITLFELLTVNKRKMAKYLKNDELVSELRLKISQETFISSYSYYCSTLNKRYSGGVYYEMLKSNAANCICNIFEGRLNREHLIIDKIIDFLDDQNLEYLYLSSKATRHRSC